MWAVLKDERLHPVHPGQSRCTRTAGLPGVTCWAPPFTVLSTVGDDSTPCSMSQAHRPVLMCCQQFIWASGLGFILEICELLLREVR